MNKLYSL